MPYPIEKKLVVGVSTNALFNLQYEHSIFEEKGVEDYAKYQNENKLVPMARGCAFPFIRRLLKINEIYSEQKPVEVVLLSKNSPETGVRAFNSIREYDLDISRGCFTSGSSSFEYIPAFNVSLFLSGDRNDVTAATENSFPAGLIIPTNIIDNEEDVELRVAFDFDGVLADDEAEKVYKKTNQLDLFHEHEVRNVEKPLNSGPCSDFFRKLSYFQKLETKKIREDPAYRRILKTSIVTARNAPSHERAINTLKSWSVEVDEMFLLGGIEKKKILEVLKPHIFFDDQIKHLDPSIVNVPLVHIPFGIANCGQ